LDSNINDPNYNASHKVYQSNDSLIILSRNTLMLRPITEVIGRVGFHMTDILRLGIVSVSTPQELYVGEHDIKQGLEKHPELAIYARLIDTYPIKK